MTLGYLDPIAFHLFTKPVYWYGNYYSDYSVFCILPSG